MRWLVFVDFLVVLFQSLSATLKNYPCRFSNIAIGTQQVAYTWTAAEACTVKSIRLDAGATAITATPDTNVAYVLVRSPRKGIMLITSHIQRWQQTCTIQQS